MTFVNMIDTMAVDANNKVCDKILDFTNTAATVVGIPTNMDAAVAIRVKMQALRHGMVRNLLHNPHRISSVACEG